jgi:hypothetical protein
MCISDSNWLIDGSIAWCDVKGVVNKKLRNRRGLEVPHAPRHRSWHIGLKKWPTTDSPNESLPLIFLTSQSRAQRLSPEAIARKPVNKREQGNIPQNARCNRRKCDRSDRGSYFGNG